MQSDRSVEGRPEKVCCQRQQPTFGQPELWLSSDSREELLLKSNPQVQGLHLVLNGIKDNKLPTAQTVCID